MKQSLSEEQDEKIRLVIADRFTCDEIQSTSNYENKKSLSITDSLSFSFQNYEDKNCSSITDLLTCSSPILFEKAQIPNNKNKRNKDAFRNSLKRYYLNPQLIKKVRNIWSKNREKYGIISYLAQKYNIKKTALNGWVSRWKIDLNYDPSDTNVRGIHNRAFTNEEEYIANFKMSESIKVLIKGWERIPYYIIDKGWDIYQDTISYDEDEIDFFKIPDEVYEEEEDFHENTVEVKDDEEEFNEIPAVPNNKESLEIPDEVNEQGFEKFKQSKEFKEIEEKEKEEEEFNDEVEEEEEFYDE